MLTDLRYAWRQLRHAPAFTATAVLTLALGIATTTAVFAVVNSVAFRLTDDVDLEHVTTGQIVNRIGRAYPLFTALPGLRETQRALPDPIEALTGVAQAQVTIQRPGRSERVIAELTDEHYATVFRIRPARGRWLEPDDTPDAAPSRVAVVSDRLWREWFAATGDEPGTATIRINRQAYTVVGVAARDHRGLLPAFAAEVDVWLPLASPVFAAAQPVTLTALPYMRWRMSPPPSHVARGLLDAMVTDAMAQIERSLRRDALRYGRPLDERQTPAAFQLAMAEDALGHAMVRRYGVLAVAIGSLVLLAACANFGNLLHARASQRLGEVAVRLSLGASRWRVLRLLVAESMITALLASAAGLTLGLVAVQLFGSAFPALSLGRGEVRPLDLSPDWRVVVFAFASGMVAATAVGLLSAWRTSRAPLQTVVSASAAAFGHSPRQSRALRTALVAIQVTVAVVLVIGAATTIESYLASLERSGMRGRRIHFDASQIISAGVDLRAAGEDEFNEPRGRQFFDRLLAAVSRLPDVAAAGLADRVPGAVGSAAPGTGYLALADTAEGLGGDRRRGVTAYVRVSPGFLRVLDLRLIQGRDIQPNDGHGAPLVAVVSRSTAEMAWPGQDPIGRQIRWDKDVVTVVGVSADPVSSDDRSPWRAPANVVFLPFAQHYVSRMHLVVRTPAPVAQVDAIRAAVIAIDPDVPVMDAATVEQGVLAWSAASRAFLTFATSLGIVSLAIAMLGVYGVISFFVSTRTREIGIRSALGATPGRVLKMVVDHAIHIVLVGLLCGVLVASLGSRVLLAAQPRIMPNGLTAWIVVPLLILASGILAGYIPARRAARIDPNVALREL